MLSVIADLIEASSYPSLVLNSPIGSAQESSPRMSRLPSS